MKKENFIKFIAAVFFMLIVTSCATTRISFEGANADIKAQETFPKELYIPESFNWENITSNGEISYFKYANDSMPVIYHCVKILLNSENLKLTYAPDENTIPSEKYNKLSTKSFALKSKSNVAINFTQFKNESPFTFTFAGIHRINGINYSNPINRYCALCIKKINNNETVSYNAEIIENQNMEEIENWDYAFGGFFQVLKDGIPQTFVRHSYDSRTGVGLSKDGNTLFILVAEGNNSNQSIGISYQQSAQIFKAMGAWNAMQADGGNSSDLCINGKSVLNQTLTVIQGSSIGFKTLSEK